MKPRPRKPVNVMGPIPIAPPLQFRVRVQNKSRGLQIPIA